HGAGTRIANLALAQPLRRLRDLRVGGGDLTRRRLALCFGSRHLSVVRRNLPRLRDDLIVLGLQALAEDAELALRLIHLLRRGGLLSEETSGSLVGPLGDRAFGLDR